MRERRRSGWLVLPATRPPADRAWRGLSAGSDHDRHHCHRLDRLAAPAAHRLALVRVISDGREEAAEPATAAPPD